MRKLWLKVIRFSYRRIAGPDGEPDGVPGRRDPDALCHGYSPRKRQNGDWDCEGDGHYLCFECCHLGLHIDEWETAFEDK